MGRGRAEIHERFAVRHEHARPADSHRGGTGGPAIIAHIPVGGFFSPAQSLSVSWDQYQTVQSGVTVTLSAGDIVFAGSKFGGGAAPAFLAIFGL